MQYNRGPRVRNVPKNHVSERLAQKKRENKPEDYFLSLAHLKDCLEKLRTTAGLAPGPDGLTFKSLDDKTQKKMLSRLANLIREKKYQPGKTRLVKIKKEDGSFREIRISNLVDRVASRAAMDALAATIETRFVDWSYAFIKNRSYKDIFEKIKHDYANGCVFIAKLDICKAFDNVNVRKLRSLLATLNLSPKLFNLVEGIIYQGINEENTEEENELGIQQGNSLSGLLFNFYVHELHDKHIRDNLNKYLRAYRYADDFAFLSNDLDNIKSLLNNSITALSEAGFSCKKSEIIDLRKEKIELLGLTVNTINNNIDFSLSESAISKLTNKLDEALSDHNPSCLQKQTVLGWLEATSTVSLKDEDRGRLSRLLDAYGLHISHPHLS